MLAILFRHPIITGVSLLLVNLALACGVIFLWPANYVADGGEHFSYGPTTLPYRQDSSKNLSETREEFDKEEKEAGVNSPQLIGLLEKLGDYCLSEQQIDDAVEYYERTLKLRKKNNTPEDDDFAQTLVGLAECYHQREDDSKSLEILQSALRVNQRVHGPDSLSVYCCLTKLAVIYAALNEPKYAEDSLRSALSIAEKRHVSEDGILPEAIAALAALLDDQERFTESEKLYERIVAINERELGKTNAGVAGALVGLAGNFVAQKKWTQAEDRYQRALKIAEGASQIEESTLEDIGKGYVDLLRQEKQHSQFRAVIDKVLNTGARRFGKDGEEYFSLLDALASSLRSDKDYALARDLFEKSAALKQKKHSLNSVEYVDALVDIGDTYLAEHDFASAADVYKKAMEQTKSKFDLQSGSYLGLLKSMADNYYYARDYAQAELYYKKRLEQLNRAEEKEEDVIADAWYDLGADYFTWRKYKDARAAYAKAAESSRLANGDGSTNFAYNLWACAGARGKTGDLETEERELRKVLEIYDAEEEDGSVMDVAADLSANLRKQHRDADVEAIRKRMLAYYLQRCAEPSQKKNIGSLTESYGSFLANSQYYADAEKVLKKSLEIQSKEKDFGDDDVVELRADLAQTLSALTKDEEAASVYALVVDKASNPDFFDVHEGAELLHGYAAVLRRLNKAPEADTWEARARACDPVGGKSLLQFHS